MRFLVTVRSLVTLPAFVFTYFLLSISELSQPSNPPPYPYVRIDFRVKRVPSRKSDSRTAQRKRLCQARAASGFVFPLAITSNGSLPLPQILNHSFGIILSMVSRDSGILNALRALSVFGHGRTRT